MGIRKYKPTTPGRRGASVSDFVELTRSTPEKSLLAPKSKTGGRNNSGRITTRHIGGGHKQAYRIIDFKRYDKDGVPAKVAHIEYDPQPHRPHRWKGIRPTVRGVVMNPVDHPHGGGEGRTSGGRHPVSPWGKPEGRTRDKNKASSRLIVRRRKTGKKR